MLVREDVGERGCWLERMLVREGVGERGCW